MKANVKVSSQIIFEVEASDHKEMVEKLSTLQEVFSNTTCQRCQHDARFVTREVEDNKYYEMRCLNPKCRAKLSFGVHKKGGTFFPKRNNEDGKYHQFSGWRIFNKSTGKEE